MRTVKKCIVCCLCFLTCIGTLAEKVEVLRSYGCSAMKNMMQNLVDAKKNDGLTFKTMSLAQSSSWCYAVVVFEDQTKNKTLESCAKPT